MKRRRGLVCMLLVFTSAIAGGRALAAASAGGRTLHIKLSGRHVIHDGDPNGVASATLTLNTHQLCWVFSHLAGIAPPSVARISKGSAGKTGPAMLSLGRSYKSKGCVKAPTTLLQAILSQPAGYYLTIWAGRRYPDGVVRGQL